MLSILKSALAATLLLPAVALAQSMTDLLTGHTAASIEREVHRIVSTESLWPGFDPLGIPLAIFDGRRTWLFRHPSPPVGFHPETIDGTPSFVSDGRYEAITANSSAEIGGVMTATLLLEPDSTSQPATAWAPVALHEKFHVYQLEKHPGWSANEAVLFVYPTDDADLLQLRRLESRALDRALEASDVKQAACWATTAIGLRHERFSRMDPQFAGYERMTELNEGLAYYVEKRAAGQTSVQIPADEYEPAALRHRAYDTGAAIAFLMDRILADWKEDFAETGGEPLDIALEAAIGEIAPCTFRPEEIEAERNRARADLAQLLETRAERLAGFHRQPGWRIEIEATPHQPLWPQGFDPLNVEVVGEAKVLHGRFLRLGNDSAAIEVLGGEALTEGIGPHPLFNGVRRVVLTGLEEPQIETQSNTLRIRADGIEGSFENAVVEREGTTITIRANH